MSTQIRWLGHSCIEIVTDGQSILIDPFLTGNPAATVTAKDMKPDFILISHGHGDHVGDAIDIARRTGATIVTNYEIGEWLKEKGLENVHGLQHGGGVNLPFGRVKLTIAFHGSVLPDGSYGGNPVGFLIKTKDGHTIYDAADTGLFGDMSLIGDEGIDLAFLPIGDYYTMGPDDAVKAVKLLRAKKVVPIHYDTFPPIRQDAHAWASKVRESTGAHAVILNPGGTLSL
jgi:L-ascorbate metabolism protein UlaG (beta-lactamase superfamily)